MRSPSTGGTHLLGPSAGLSFEATQPKGALTPASVNMAPARMRMLLSWREEGSRFVKTPPQGTWESVKKSH